MYSTASPANTSSPFAFFNFPLSVFAPLSVFFSVLCLDDGDKAQTNRPTDRHTHTHSSRRNHHKSTRRDSSIFFFYTQESTTQRGLAERNSKIKKNTREKKAKVKGRTTAAIKLLSHFVCVHYDSLFPSFFLPSVPLSCCALSLPLSCVP